MRMQKAYEITINFLYKFLGGQLEESPAFTNTNTSYLRNEYPEASLVSPKDGEVEDLVSGWPGESDRPSPGLGGAGEVEEAQLPGHALPLQSFLKLLQEVHHLRVHLEVGEVVVHPQQNDPRHPVAQGGVLEPAGGREWVSTGVRRVQVNRVACSYQLKGEASSVSYRLCVE